MPGLHGHFRRHMLCEVPKLQDCLQFADYQNELPCWDMEKTSMETSWWVIVWLCFVGLLSVTLRGFDKTPIFFHSGHIVRCCCPTYLVLVLVGKVLFLFWEMFCLSWWRDLSITHESCVCLLESFVSLCFLVCTKFCYIVCLVGKFCLSVSLKSCISLFCWKVLSRFSSMFISFVASMDPRQKWVRYFCYFFVPPTSVCIYDWGSEFISEVSDHGLD